MSDARSASTRHRPVIASPDDEPDDFQPWGPPPRTLGPPPRMLADAIRYLASGFNGEPCQLGTNRLAEGIAARPHILRRTLAKRPDLITSWRYRRQRVWRLTAAGERIAARLAAGMPPNEIDRAQ